MAGSLTPVRSAWMAWGVFAVVIAVAVVADPMGRSVTPNYFRACRNWFGGLPLYEEGPHGFLYLPQAALLFAPFAYLPSPWGELAWRAAGMSALIAAMWRLALLLGQRRKAAVFLLATLTAIPPALASARNGQMNLLLASLTALAFVALAARQRRAAAAWLCLGLALKPLMAFPMMVAAAVDRRIIPTLATGLLIVVAAPFLLHDPHYVWQQYGACLSKLCRAGAPGAANPHADLFGMLAATGITMPMYLQPAIRALVAMVAICLCHAARRHMSAARAGVYVLTLTCGCLALINPRMENNGYVVLAPALAGLAVLAWTRLPRRLASGFLVATAAVGIAGSYELTRGPNFWLCPAFTSFVILHVILSFGKKSFRGAALRRPTSPLLAEGCDHDLTVIIPAYNERRRLPQALTALRSWLDASHLDYRVLVVDDGSTDGTALISSAFSSRFRTLCLPEHRGKGAAVRAGMRAATGRVVAFTDADMPYSLDALRVSVEWIESGCCDVVFGARDIAGATTQLARRRARALASRLFRCLTKQLISRDVTDTQCGFKVFSSRAARIIFGQAIVDGFAFDAEVVWLCRRLGIAWRRVPVALVNEHSSTLSISRDAWRMIWDLARISIMHIALPGNKKQQRRLVSAAAPASAGPVGLGCRRGGLARAEREALAGDLLPGGVNL